MSEQKLPMMMGDKGLVLQDLDTMYRFSKYVVAGGFAPKGLERPESVMIVIQSGYEMGLSPMQSLQNIACINNRPYPYGSVQLGLIHASGLLEDYKTWFEGKPYEDDYTACCTMKRKNLPPVTNKYSVAMAKKAGLWNKSGPWQTAPESMLRWRAIHPVEQQLFPDVTRGFLPAELARDTDAIDVQAEVTPVTVTETQEHVDSVKAKAKAKVKPEPEPETEPAEVVEEEEPALEDGEDGLF